MPGTSTREYDEYDLDSQRDLASYFRISPLESALSVRSVIGCRGIDDVNNVDSGASQDIKDDEGTKTISSLCIHSVARYHG